MAFQILDRVIRLPLKRLRLKWANSWSTSSILSRTRMHTSIEWMAQVDRIPLHIWARSRQWRTRSMMPYTEWNVITVNSRWKWRTRLAVSRSRSMNLMKNWRFDDLIILSKWMKSGTLSWPKMLSLVSRSSNLSYRTKYTCNLLTISGSYPSLRKSSRWQRRIWLFKIVRSPIWVCVYSN